MAYRYNNVECDTLEELNALIRGQNTANSHTEPHKQTRPAQSQTRACSGCGMNTCAAPYCGKKVAVRVK